MICPAISIIRSKKIPSFSSQFERVSIVLIYPPLCLFKTHFYSDRGPLVEGWRDDQPIMCSYKLVDASFEVWGFQTRVEDFIQKCIRDILLLGHRQAFTWIDSWYDMTIEDVRAYEKQAQAETNSKVVPIEGLAVDEALECENDTFEDCIDDDVAKEAE